ncbi:hypothetical protein E3N88_35924 [Mikania micrantha]|uniref:Ionotropic glutamate receptor C-terminal domain-containing protein n=1 Tax=Mikania micrantha TaxID=192012 RepID=A0A5N6M2A8_9ASTR|nr:hypothetical protein E3N88_35924 [Mikania micrantha]
MRPINQLRRSVLARPTWRSRHPLASQRGLCSSCNNPPTSPLLSRPPPPPYSPLSLVEAALTEAKAACFKSLTPPLVWDLRIEIQKGFSRDSSHAFVITSGLMGPAASCAGCTTGCTLAPVATQRNNSRKKHVDGVMDVGRGRIQPLFKPVDEQGNYTQIVMKLQGQDCDAVAGDITITSNRTKYADFTIPYMSSEIYMLVPAERKWNQTILTLLKPFTLRLWLLILTVWMLTGATIGYLEYRSENPDFYHAPLHKSLFMIIWFPVSKFFFQEGEIRNRCSKFVFVVWLVTIFIVMQIFTACLSSWLTINQLQPKVLPKEHQVVGYQNGSFIVDFVNDHAQSSGITTNPIALSSLDDYKNVLDNGTVDAIYDERPYIDIFLAKYGDSYMKVGPIAAEPGFGFAFTRGFTLLQNFSQAIIKVIEYPDMTSKTETYLGIQTRLRTLSDDVSFPQSLSPMSFSLLFAFASLSIVAAILISEITRMCTRNNSNKSSETMSIIPGNGSTHAEC